MALSSFLIEVGNACDADDEKAFMWLFLASDLSYYPSKVSLALLYIEGRGIERDIDTAKVLLNQVIEEANNAPEETKAAAKRELDYIYTGNYNK